MRFFKSLALVLFGCILSAQPCVLSPSQKRQAESLGRYPGWIKAQDDPALHLRLRQFAWMEFYCDRRLRALGFTPQAIEDLEAEVNRMARTQPVPIRLYDEALRRLAWRVHRERCWNQAENDAVQDSLRKLADDLKTLAGK